MTAMTEGEMKSARTTSEEFVVFHKNAAGSPELFNDPGGDWYFQPANPHGGDDVYSAGFPTREIALAAAEAWEEQSRWEAERLEAEQEVASTEAGFSTKEDQEAHLADLAWLDAHADG